MPPPRRARARRASSIHPSIPSPLVSRVSGGPETAAARKLAAQLEASLGLPAPSRGRCPARAERAGCWAPACNEKGSTWQWSTTSMNVCRRRANWVAPLRIEDNTWSTKEYRERERESTTERFGLRTPWPLGEHGACMLQGNARECALVFALDPVPLFERLARLCMCILEPCSIRVACVCMGTVCVCQRLGTSMCVIDSRQ